MWNQFRYRTAVIFRTWPGEKSVFPTMKALLLECPKWFAHKIFQEWSKCFINVNVESFSLIRSLINHKMLPRRRREKGKCKKSFWKERLLSRVRMGLLPTRSWAFDMKFTSRDNYKHCGTHSESLDYLFGDCTAIDDTLLREFLS